MRIVLIGVSHWHTPFYSDPVMEMKDATIVGVSDPGVSRAATLAATAKCPAFADYRDMCATLKPDFAFVLGYVLAYPFALDRRVDLDVQHHPVLQHDLDGGVRGRKLGDELHFRQFRQYLQIFPQRA